MKKIILSVLLPLSFFMPFAQCQETKRFSNFINIIPKEIYKYEKEKNSQDFYFIRFFKGKMPIFMCFGQYATENKSVMEQICQIPDKKFKNLAVVSEYNFQDNTVKNIFVQGGKIEFYSWDIKELKERFTKIVEECDDIVGDRLDIQALIIKKDFSSVYVVYVDSDIQHFCHLDLSSHDNMNKEQMEQLKIQRGQQEFEIIEKTKKVLSRNFNNVDSQGKKLGIDISDISKHKNSSSSTSTGVE